MNLHFLKTKDHNKQLCGFTVIELMVTIAIVVLVTGLIMIQYSSFNNSVLLRNQAYMTSFDLREAQSLAIGVKGQGAEFREEYGVYFDMNVPTSYLLFQDNDDDYPAHYDVAEKIGIPYRVDPRFIIKDICATNSSSRTCHSTDSTLNTLAVSFRRPDFEASFYSPSKSNIQSAEIIFGTASGVTDRSVIIYKTGQVSVD
jgi:type II secretory pathway pseudopilin PulG